MLRLLTSLRGLLSLGVVVVLVGGVWIFLDGTPGGDSPDPGDPAPGDPPGDGAPGGDGSGDGDPGNGGDGSGDGSGNGGGAGPSDGDGAPTGDDSPGGSGSGGVPGAGTPPPPGGLCGPQEFLGGLIPFVAALGDPNLLDVPEPMQILVDSGIGPSGPFSGPIGGALNVPGTVIGGFNQTYGLLAAELPAECGGITGDPHIMTLDQRYYDFQAVGEYWAFRSEDDSFHVQIRTRPMGTSGRVSTVAGVATEVDGRLLVVDETAEDLVTLDGALLEPESTAYTDNGGAIVYIDDGVAVYWPDGQTTMALSHFDRSALSVHFTVGEELQGRVSGLMGNVDGNRNNDLALPDGTLVTGSFEAIHGEFADAWRVADAEIWFEVPSVYRDEYPTEVVSLSTAERESAREICVSAGVLSTTTLESCTIDVAMSGDSSFAEIFASDELERTPLVAAECELALGGERHMGGMGPARLWQANAAPQLDAQPLWRFTVEDMRPPDVSRVMPLGDTALVIDTNNGLHRIDAAGTVLSTVELSALAEVEPVAIGDSVIVATQEGVAGVAPDGSVCWHLLTHVGENVVTLGMSDDRIIATTEADNGRVSVALALDPQSGAVLWERPIEANVRQFGSKVAPGLADGVGYFEGPGGGIIALALDDGETLWSYEPERPPNVVHALAATAEGIVAAVRPAGVRMLAADTGEVIWSAAPRVAIPIAMAVGDRQVVIVGAFGAEAIDLTSGESLWLNEDAKLLGLSDQQPVIAQGVVYSYAPDRNIVGLDLATGEEVARLNADLGVSSSNSYESFVSFPMMLGDVLLAINLSGDIEAFR